MYENLDNSFAGLSDKGCFFIVDNLVVRKDKLPFLFQFLRPWKFHTYVGHIKRMRLHRLGSFFEKSIWNCGHMQAVPEECIHIFRDYKNSMCLDGFQIRSAICLVSVNVQIDANFGLNIADDAKQWNRKRGEPFLFWNPSHDLSVSAFNWSPVFDFVR